MTVPISIVVAVARNGVIGRDGGMPWKLSTDLKRFKALTMGKPILLGRKTLESFGGKPLPGRPHVIVTRNGDLTVEGARTATSVTKALDEARRIAADSGAAELCVIGGGEIYRQVMDVVDVLYVTHVEVSVPDGDTFFPAIDPDVFEKVEETLVPAGEKDDHPTRYAVYRRRAATN